MDILHLILIANWYDMIESDIKKEEYREITDYWKSRLLNRTYDMIKFRNGYQKTSRTMFKKFISITIGRGNPEWGAPTDRDVFIIKFE